MMIEEQTSLRNPIREFFRNTLIALIQALIIASFIIYFVAQAQVVQGRSMEPNLETDNRIIVEKVSYRFDTPARGDVIVADIMDVDVPLIKRVIGLPGDVVEIRNNQLLINGQIVNEPYKSAVYQQNYGPITVPTDHIFVMGDNRPLSRDSRAFGAVHLNQVVGRAWISYWPPADVGLVE